MVNVNQNVSGIESGLHVLFFWQQNYFRVHLTRLLTGVNLRVATLKNANLQNCDLRTAVLAGADLENCDLSGCDLHEANLRGANLKGAAFELMLNPLHMSQTVP